MNPDFVDQEKKTLSFVVSIEEDNHQLELDMELLELEDSSDSNSNVLLQCTVNQAQPDVSSPVSSGNRRYTLRPKKRTFSSDCQDSSTDTTVPVSSPTKKRRFSQPNKGCLETIYEHPEVAKNGSLLVLGKAKIKRFITFNDFVTKTKNKTRRLKVKRLNKSRGKKPKRPKITIEDVKLKLKCLEESNDENESMTIED